MEHLSRRGRAVTLGELALVVDLDIARMETLLEEMLTEETVRFLTQEEKHAQGLDRRCSLVLLR